MFLFLLASFILPLLPQISLFVFPFFSLPLLLTYFISFLLSFSSFSFFFSQFHFFPIIKFPLMFLLTAFFFCFYPFSFTSSFPISLPPPLPISPPLFHRRVIFSFSLSTSLSLSSLFFSLFLYLAYHSPVLLHLSIPLFFPPPLLLSSSRSLPHFCIPYVVHIFVFSFHFYSFSPFIPSTHFSLLLFISSPFLRLVALEILPIFPDSLFLLHIKILHLSFALHFLPCISLSLFLTFILVSLSLSFSLSLQRTHSHILLFNLHFHSLSFPFLFFSPLL